MVFSLQSEPAGGGDTIVINVIDVTTVKIIVKLTEELFDITGTSGISGRKRLSQHSPHL
jgi:hypothetical protein